MDCPKEFQAAHKFQNFWAVLSKPDFFSSLPKLLPQTTALMLGLKLIWQSHKVMWTTWQI
jgi:hypothetical protein